MHIPNEIVWERHQAHIERHLPSNKDSKGSKFYAESFAEVLNLVRAALATLPEDTDQMAPEDVILSADGQIKVLVRMPEVIGTVGVAHIASLPPRTEVRRALRGSGEDAHEVNEATLRQQPTRNLVIFLAPSENGWYLFSAFPGLLAPGFEDQVFWGAHAFLVDPA